MSISENGPLPLYLLYRADSHDNFFLKGLFYLEDYEFGGTKVIGSGKKQNM